MDKHLSNPHTLGTVSQNNQILIKEKRCGVITVVRVKGRAFVKPCGMGSFLLFKPRVGKLLSQSHKPKVGEGDGDAENSFQHCMGRH